MIGRLIAAGLLLVALPVAAQVQDTTAYLQRMDADADGRVSPDEYLQWMFYAFDRMDRNGNGVLEAAEQPGGRGKPITREEQRQVILARFARQDADSDGYLSARELMAPPR
ncbi:hypothetical protein [Stenotrophomonas sp. SY1]|uniref:hypothetical protein n=1 Tax=Stenotrophomonas sp. SY1 TaxID=477235 RepID=UPI001E5FC427|nr:hypothetical protein [Stenotrophomonas sp. SY1]MCD9088510.1 hypothetical protein [Stenotrophomonas sp. SY1]